MTVFTLLYDYDGVCSLVKVNVPFSQTHVKKPSSLRIAVIGQSQFGADVYSLLRRQGHQIVGVFTILDKNDRADPLGR